MKPSTKMKKRYREMEKKIRRIDWDHFFLRKTAQEPRLLMAMKDGVRMDYETDTPHKACTRNQCI